MREMVDEKSWRDRKRLGGIERWREIKRNRERGRGSDRKCHLKIHANRNR